MEDFYELLGVSEDAPTDEIHRAWRERVHRYHPDVNDDARANAQFKTLKTAHEVLTDDTERAAYDRLGHEAYVRQRLDGLPTTRDQSDGGAAETGHDGSDGGGSGTDTGRDGQAGTTAGGRAESTDRGDRRTAESTGSVGTSGTEAAESRSRNRNTDAGTATASSERRAPPRRPLAYGWAGVAVAGAGYLLGLWAYLGANVGALAALFEAPVAALPSALMREDLLPPGTFVLDAVATGAVQPLVFAAGAVGLAVGFVAVVASFGRGAAYLYAIGGLAPLAALAIGPLVAAPDGATLALAVVVPAATVGLFLIDVGRALLGGP